ncbi:MAG: hypothetical protein MUE96_06640 [Bacteroidia bacterium]|jgi:hypothetical protein|nr:hypothetical protein [Bacteroidia bacterium]
MKKYTFTLCFLALTFLAFSQSDTLFGNRSFRIQGQVGINATSFIKNFIVLNSSNIPDVSPYSINVKGLVGFKAIPSFMFGPRFGVGYLQRESSSNNEAQDNERSDKEKSRDYRLGLEVQQIISKRFTLLYGIDYVYGMNESSTITTTLRPSPNPPFNGIPTRTETKSDFKTNGFGPFLGIQFAINKYLVLSTEAALIKQEGRGGSRTISDNPNNTIAPTFFQSKSTEITLPFFINCNFVF